MKTLEMRSPAKTPLKILALTAVFCLGAARPVTAQAGTSQPTTLNVSVAGLGCGTNQFGVLSFSWGASNPVSIGPGGPASGKVSISSFNIMKSFDACSPALFGAAVHGTKFSTVTMVQSDKKGVALMTVTLSEVFVESIQWSGSEASGQTTESVSFAFGKVCVQDGPSGNKLCYDSNTAKTF